MDDVETSEQEFQKATEVLCVDGGASLHTSHRQLKQWAREVNAAEPPVESRKPLKWSSTPIVFDIEDHPDRTTAIGCLPMSGETVLHEHLWDRSPFVCPVRGRREHEEQIVVNTRAVYPGLGRGGRVKPYSCLACIGLESSGA